MNAVRIISEFNPYLPNIYLPNIIITDINEANDVPYGEGVTIIKNIRPDLTVYKVIMD